jgi:subtilisin family serine protease
MIYKHFFGIQLKANNMNKYLVRFVIPIYLILISFSLTSQIQYVDYQDGVIIFQLKTNEFFEVKSKERIIDYQKVSFLSPLSSKYDVEKLIQLYPNHKSEKLSRTFQINFNEIQKVDDFIIELNNINVIEYAEKKELHKNFFTPNDQYFSNSTSNGQWALFQINAEQAWDLSTGSSTIVVAVTDNAINVNHPDLINKMLTGYDAVDQDNDPTGCGSNTGFHGSHVSGIVGAETNNNTGIASIGYDISVLPVKIGNCNGSLVAGYEGITWAADNGADVINMSWGGSGFSTYGQNVCDYAANQGAILVAAAGNDNVSSVFYPAGYNNVVSVASTTTNDGKSSFSNYGTWIDISSPGSSILSCNETSGYQVTQGTSMASPLVAGLLGLMKSYAPNANNQDLINCLYSSAENIDAVNSNYVGELGAGRIDAHQALLCLNAFSFSLDAAVSEIISPKDNICSSSIDPIVTLRNYGSNNLTSADIVYQISGGTVQTYNWSGNLSSGQSEDIYLPNQTLTAGSYTFTAYSTNPNGSTDQNPTNDQQTSNFNIINNGQNIDITIITDCYGNEVTWSIVDALGSTVSTGGPYANITGGQSNTESVCVAPGCYDFFINDSYGDGMYGSQWNGCTVDGDYYINDANGANLVQMTAQNADFGYGTSHNFCVISPNINYDASISSVISPNGTSCSSTIDPEVTLSNFGSQPLTSVTINYQLSTGPWQSYSWNGSLASGQNTNVILPNMNLNSGNQNFIAFTSNPNGNADQNPLNDSSFSQIVVFTNSIPLPFYESFESNSFTTNSWTIDNVDNSETWEIVTITGTNPGDKAAKLNFFQYSQLGQRDAMITSPINFIGYNNLDLSFEHAYRRYDQNSTDSLIVSISTDCGNTYTRLLELGEDGTGSFATAYTSTADFTPSQTTDWCLGTVGADCFSVNLDSYIGNTGVILKFESYNAGTNGNNLFIDNINIDGTPNSSPPNADFNTINTTICSGDIITFNDLSTSNITSWLWDFGDGNTSNQQNPSHTYSSPGSYDISLTVTNSNGTDTYSLTNYITVSASDDASINPVSPMCIADAPITLSSITSGGSWLGNGITNSSNGNFDPSIAGAGTHTITYYTSGACPDTATIDIDIVNLIDATIDSVNTLCFTGSPIILTAANPGGTWAGTGVIDPTNGIFDPQTSGIGTHTISYTISGNCGNTDQILIQVSNTLDATIYSSGPYCTFDIPDTLSAVDGGGTWTGNGITNSTFGIFDPSLAGPGTHVITYVIMGACGDMSTSTITVENSNPQFTLPTDSLCTDNSPITIVPNQTGGAWSGNGINSNGVFDPMMAGPGNHNITYSFSGNCPSSHSDQIVVITSVNSSIGFMNSLCVTSAPVPLIGTPSGGVWSGNGITDPVNGVFDPSIAGVGTHNITYTIEGLCGDETSSSIMVDDCSAINENPISDLSIFPNPNNGEFIIKITASSPFIDNLKIMDQLGKIIYNKTINVNSSLIQVPIHLQELSDGVYYIQFNRITKKIIKL